MSTFANDGINFHYRDEGSGLPFFFQHGLGADLTQPFSLCQPPPGIRLIAFDARAHGQTQPVGPEERISLSSSADDLLTLMDHLQIREAIVGGISMGAAITLNFTLRFPERVVGLVQSRPAWLDAPCPWNVQMFSLVSRLIREQGRLNGKRAFLQSPEYHDTQKQWRDVATSLAGQFDNPQIEQSAFKFERIIKDTPSRDRCEWVKIKVPTLVMANRRDPIHPFEYAEVMAQQIPGAALRELTPKSLSLDQHNADVQRHLLEFFRNHFLGR